MSTTGVPVGTVVDGSMLYASEDISMTLGGSAVVFYSKTIRFSDTASRIEGENSAAVVIRKAYHKKGYLTGTADLMYPSTGTAAYPPALTQFTMTVPEISSTALSCTVLESSPSRGNDAEATCSITFDTNIGTVTVGS